MAYRLRFQSIGSYSYIGKPVYIRNPKNIKIGSHVRIYPGARMETEGKGVIEIENNVAIGQNFHITSGQERLVIKRDTTILGNVFITNIDHDYREIGIHVMDQNEEVTTTYIGENCFIGYGAAIQAGTVLGKQCVVGANSVVRGIFPDYSVIAGAPGRIVKRYNKANRIWEAVSKEERLEKMTDA